MGDIPWRSRARVNAWGSGALPAVYEFLGIDRLGNFYEWMTLVKE